MPTNSNRGRSRRITRLRPPPGHMPSRPANKAARRREKQRIDAESEEKMRRKRLKKWSERRIETMTRLTLVIMT